MISSKTCYVERCVTPRTVGPYLSTLSDVWSMFDLGSFVCSTRPQPVFQFKLGRLSLFIYSKEHEEFQISVENMKIVLSLQGEQIIM